MRLRKGDNILQKETKGTKGEIEVEVGKDWFVKKAVFGYDLLMGIRTFLLLPLVFLLAGCVHVNESSATANKEQIRDRIAGQLHCKTLELVAEGKDRYTGTGQNDSGAFTIAITREGGNLLFHGVYIQPAHGTFSGSASWEKHFNSFCGFTKEHYAERTSMGTP